MYNGPMVHSINNSRNSVLTNSEKVQYPRKDTKKFVHYKQPLCLYQAPWWNAMTSWGPATPSLSTVSPSRSISTQRRTGKQIVIQPIGPPSVADPGCLSRILLFSIPDPNCLHSGSA
jgi:hypothetical protein